MPKSFFVDTSRCTACRGCQLACKEWNELAANKTKQVGTHQNPPDLNANNYKLVRFNEHVIDGIVRWFFFPDQCRHCLTPPCKIVADSILEGAITQNEQTGTVLFTAETKKISKEDFQTIKESCPYDIPRRHEDTGLMSKCTMCFERITNGMLPACVKVCPTGTMNFGEREAMLELAKTRLAEVKKTFPRAMLANPEDVNTIFLILDDPKYYHATAVAANDAPAPMDRKAFLAKLTGPFGRLVRDLS